MQIKTIITNKNMKKIAKVSAPAKAILCGQHAVVYGEDAIAFGVDLNCHGDIWKRTQADSQPNSITINMKIGNETKIANFSPKTLKLLQSIPKTNTKIQFDSYSLNDVEFGFQQFCQSLNAKDQVTDKIILTTLYKIALFFEIFSITQINVGEFLKNQHFVIETTSQIPIGKGLGSSASFNSVLAASLMLITGTLKKPTHNQNYKGIINHLSKIFEKVEHGQPSGIDNFVSIFGGMVLFNKSKSPQFKLIENQKILKYLSESLSIAFVDSGIQKNTKLAVSNVREKYNLYLTGENKYKNMIEEIGKFPNQIIQLLSSQQLDESDKKDQLFKILALNHEYLKEFGLSNKQIEEIVDRYTVEGRAVGKITGAGMGGVVLIVGEKHFMNEAQKTETGSFILSKMNTHGLQIQFFE